MKQVLFATVLLSTTLSFSQRQSTAPSQSDFASWARQYCHAPWASADTPERQRFRRVGWRLLPVVNRTYAHGGLYYIAIDSPTINAWTVPLKTRDGKEMNFVCMPMVFVRMLDSDGELAFILGHETGHAVDEPCKNAMQQNWKDLALHRTCETRADTIGFKLLMASGYTPYDAGGAFGKLEMYLGDTRTNLQAQMRNLASDHPMTPERIENMRKLLIQYNTALKGATK